jgi:hypothetical protein
VITGTKPHTVPPINFNADLMECVVTAATKVQEWQEAYNVSRNGNPSANVDYQYRALHCKGMPWILTKDDLLKMICEVEHDSNVAGYMGQDKRWNHTVYILLARNRQVC